MREYTYEAPKSFDDLFAVIGTNRKQEIKLLAGGTDMVPRLNLEMQSVPIESKSTKIVYLGMLGLDTVTEKNGVVSIGAFSVLTDLEKNKIIQNLVPALSETIHEMAGLTIRNTATIGGNIMNASPAADSVPTLMALDANFVLSSQSGERIVNASEFFTGPGKTVIKKGEILSKIKIKINEGKAAFKKLGRRQAESLSVVNAAAYVESEDGKCKEIRIAVGSAAPTVVRCKSAEEAMKNQELSESVIKKACDRVLDDISPIDDLRSSAWHRNKVAPVMAARAVMEAAGIKQEAMNK